MTEEVGHAGVFQTLRETSASVHYVLLGVFINQFGAFLRTFLVLYLTTARGFSAGLAGLALGFYAVGSIFGSLLGGALADRIGPRWTIAGTMSTAALFTLSVTFLSAYPLIVAAAVISGAMTNASSPAASSLLLGMVPKARQVMVFAMYRTALNAGVVIGPLVAVWLSTISWNLVFYVDAATAVGYALIAALKLRDRDAAPAAPDTAEDGSPVRLRSRYATMLRDGRYLAYLGLMLANGLVHIQFWVVLPLMVVAEGYPTWVYGAAMGTSAFVVISCELLVTKATQKWPAWLSVIGGWVLLAVGYGAFGLPGGIALVFAGTLIAVVGQIIGGPAAFAYPGKVAPKHAMGLYVSGAQAMFGTGYALGPIIGVFLWNSVGKGFWGLVFLFGMLMVGPGIWGLRADRSETPKASDDVVAEPAG
ncbi:MFS transporter [Labedaea rhizosphaerae]|uniref:MFS transporter n=1 Tax=Labedaea rhizosphaerae TaxID=598644 RepID=A0A4R6S390_LABRH|nr:MFS transporter [Labedaea rhizosphaerae]TDP94061.1 MFS transporter [Labedaea rhizosphaerae]